MAGTAKVQHKSVVPFVDLREPNAVEAFRKATAVFTKNATKSRTTARKVLVQEGILTRKGTLSKNYK